MTCHVSAQRPWLGRALSACLLLSAALRAGTAGAADHVYVVAIGNNAAPVDSDETLTTLEFADDDALSFAELAQNFSDGIDVLTLPDATTQARHASWDMGRVQAPNLANLQRAVRRVSLAIAGDKARGERSQVILFFSGHGTRTRGGEPILALEGEGLSFEHLRRMLAQWTDAAAVHVMVDACHAESVVRARGATIVPLDAAAAHLARQQTSLRQFPNVGTILATTQGRLAHEWSVLEKGVFTHELLSALRGAADVNADSSIEYSELAAFFAAANRDVSDARARLQVVTEPPTHFQRAPVVDLRTWKRVGWLTGDVAALGHLIVEDASGSRLLDAHAEVHASWRAALPADRELFVRTQRGDAALSLASGRSARAESLHFEPPAQRSRGAMAAALEKGLFRTPFGPTYYTGYADSNGWLPVSMATSAPPPTQTRSLAPAVTLLAVSGAATIAAATLGAVAMSARAEASANELQVPSMRAFERYQTTGIAALVCAGIAVSSGIAGAWLWPAPAPDGGAAAISALVLPNLVAATYAARF